MPGSYGGVDFSSVPFSRAPGAMFSGLSGSPQQALAALGPAYQSSYDAALNFNQRLGDTVNTGYNNLLAAQQGSQQEILNDIANYGQSSRQGLIDQHAYNTGKALTSMISRGLGNTTVLDSAQRGYNYDYAKANLQLDDQLAAMKANLKNQFIGQNTNLGGSQLAFLERMSGPYPNASLYAGLASQYGAAAQSDKNQQSIRDQLGRAGGGFGMQQALPGIGAGGQGRPQSAYRPIVGGFGDVGIYGPTGGGGAYQPAGWSPPAGDPFAAYDAMYGAGGGGQSDWGYYGDFQGNLNYDASYDPSLSSFYQDMAGAGSDPYALLGYSDPSTAYYAGTGSWDAIPWFDEGW